MKSGNEDAGNSYVLVETVKGVPTFRHVATGENLHGQAGPWEETMHLYIGPSGLLEMAGSCVVYDVGMGCAAQVLGALCAWRKNKNLRRCVVVSFDLEKRGVEALLQECALFPFAHGERGFLEQMVQRNEVSLVLEDGREFAWSFVSGDFRETIRSDLASRLPLADVVFYDFFSPSSHPHLWTYDVFRHLRERVSHHAVLFTYSCATRVRAAMLAADFCVGLGVPSGKKAKTTVASPRYSLLREPLPLSWLTTFQRSHAGFLECEDETLIPVIRQKVLEHRQFQNTPC
jgi:tRNA U34 5-methylaminomethyl-2-thiouridine-forming methyltransferase MnmC